MVVCFTTFLKHGLQKCVNNFQEVSVIYEVFMFEAPPDAWGRGASPIQQLAEGSCQAAKTRAQPGLLRASAQFQDEFCGREEATPNETPRSHSRMGFPAPKS